MNSPCKDCPDRHIGCHSDCDKYINYRKELEQLKEQQYKENLKPQFKKPIPGNFYKNKWKKKIKEE